MKLNFSLIFTFCSSFLLGQIITVSEPITLRNDLAYHILGEQEDNILLVREQTTKVEVQAYDNKMHLKWEKELDFDKGRPAMVSLVENNGLFEVLYRHRRKGKYYLKMHRYNSSANLIDSTTIKKLGPAFFTPKYETILSEDERKLMLVDFDRISKFNVLMIDLDSMKVM